MRAASIFKTEPALPRRSEKKRLAFRQALKESSGIEPLHRGFADLSLTTWVRLHNVLTLYQFARFLSIMSIICFASSALAVWIVSFFPSARTISKYWPSFISLILLHSM